MKDMRGVERGKRTSYNRCNEFVGQLCCDYCDCVAVKHVRVMDSDEKLQESKRAKVDSHENVMQREATKVQLFQPLLIMDVELQHSLCLLLGRLIRQAVSLHV